jgi:hypothetical protein
MRAPRLLFAWIEVLVGVIAWILFVPIANLIGGVLARLDRLPGSGATVGAFETRPAEGGPSRARGFGSRSQTRPSKAA